MTPLVETKGVSKHYGAFRALDDVTVSVADGEFVSIVGPNGAGKTTLVNLLTGLLVPTKGEVRFKGNNIAGVGPVVLAERGMARAFQLVQIFPQLTVAETIAAAVVTHQGKQWRLFSRLSQDAEIGARVEEIARIFGLQHRLHTVSRLLSQGEKKLLDVASAFALKPEVILLDEPTSGVSTAEKHGVMKTLIAAAGAAGVKAIILVEHDMDLVASYSQRIIALSEGRVLADLPPGPFFADPVIIETVVGKRQGRPLMLSVANLAVDIENSHILRGVSLEVKAGELVCLVGRNGAGKSTTFRTIMGQRKPVSGTITLEGSSIVGRRPYEIARLGVGFAPEESEVFGDLTVAENILLPTWTRQTARSADEREALAYRVFPKLERYRQRGGQQLSGGERKMVSIARALALDAKLLLLDEPTEGLSPAVVPSIVEGIASIRQLGHAVLIAESNLHHVPDFADRLYVIERGEIIFSGPPADARKDAAVAKIVEGTV